MLGCEAERGVSLGTPQPAGQAASARGAVRRQLGSFQWAAASPSSRGPQAVPRNWGHEGQQIWRQRRHSGPGQSRLGEGPQSVWAGGQAGEGQPEGEASGGMECP